MIVSFRRPIQLVCMSINESSCKGTAQHRREPWKSSRLDLRNFFLEETHLELRQRQISWKKIASRHAPGFTSIFHLYIGIIVDDLQKEETATTNYPVGFQRLNFTCDYFTGSHVNAHVKPPSNESRFSWIALETTLSCTSTTKHHGEVSVILRKF